MIDKGYGDFIIPKASLIPEARYVMGLIMTIHLIAQGRPTTGKYIPPRN